MKKSEYITFRTTPAVKALLEKHAEEKDRTISYIVEKIVQEWAQKQSETSELKQ